MSLNISGAASRARRHFRALVLASCCLAMTPALAEDAPVGSTTSGDGTIKVNILSLKHSEGETLTLRFEVVNNGNTDFPVVIGNMQLLDLAGHRGYGAGLGTNGCIAPAGKRLTCWAMFGAPPSSAKTLTVQLYEHLDLITGVPITD